MLCLCLMVGTALLVEERVQAEKAVILSPWSFTYSTGVLGVHMFASPNLRTVPNQPSNRVARRQDIVLIASWLVPHGGRGARAHPHGSQPAHLALRRRLNSLALASCQEGAAAVAEFVQILDEHRKTCEREGKYIEADIAKKRLEELRQHEDNRKQEGLRSRQIAQRLGVEEAHMLEFQQAHPALRCPLVPPVCPPP